MEDDTELKDLLVQTLEAKGCLAKLRAQLRASVFLSLDDDDALTKRGSMLNPKIKAYTETVEGRAMFCIVREFLEFFDLGFTMSVYEPESNMGSSYKYDGKLAIMKDLGLSLSTENSEGPLLLQLIHLLQLHSNNNTISKNGLRLCSAENNSNQQLSVTDNENSIKADIFHTNETNVSVSESVHINGKSEVCIPAGLDVTFDLSNPKIITEHENSIVDENNSIIRQNDDTFNTVSTNGSEGNMERSRCIMEAKLSEINTSVINLDKSNNSNIEIDTNSQNNLLTESIADLGVLSLALKEPKLSHKSDISSEKLKMVSHKPDRLKTKNSVSSLADLPSLQIGRNRSNDPLILPSLCSHEGKEKTHSKELDKVLEAELDSLDNYEEDFMSTSEIEPSIGCFEKNTANESSISPNKNKEDLISNCVASKDPENNLGISELNNSP